MRHWIDAKPIDDVESVHARKYMPPLNPDVADHAPSGPTLTDYDEEHAVTYVRMLDADAEGADWREVSRIVRGGRSTVIWLAPNG